jgi:hypothetical protein
MIWCDLETAAPEIARLGKERFEPARVALLGTIRKDGSPRISPVEPYGRLAAATRSKSYRYGSCGGGSTAPEASGGGGRSALGHSPNRLAAPELW